MGVVLLAAVYGFDPDHPLASVSRVRFWLTVAATGVVLLVIGAVALRRLAGRRFPVFVAFQEIFLLLYVWLVAARMVEWANAALDRGGSVRVTAQVVDAEHRRGSTRGLLGRAYLAGVRVSSRDAVRLDDTFVGQAALPRGRERPRSGATVTLRLHSGFLSIPWVDELEWSEQ